MKKIIGICNQKGGTGKSTTCFNFAAGLKDMGKRVLVVDMDPQASLTTCFGIEPSELEDTIARLIDFHIRRKPLPDVRNYVLDLDGIHLLPANIELSVIENAIVSATAREYILRKILAPLLPYYDYILLDSPPSLGMLSINVLAAAHTLIIPVKAGFLDVKGLELLLDTIGVVGFDLNLELSVGGVLITMYDKRLRLAREAKTAVEEFCANFSRIYTEQLGRPFPIPVFETVISTSVRAQESSVSRQSIFDYSPHSKTSLEYGAMVKEALAHGI